MSAFGNMEDDHFAGLDERVSFDERRRQQSLLHLQSLARQRSERARASAVNKVLQSSDDFGSGSNLSAQMRSDSAQSMGETGRPDSVGLSLGTRGDSAAQPGQPEALPSPHKPSDPSKLAKQVQPAASGETCGAAHRPTVSTTDEYQMGTLQSVDPIDYKHPDAFHRVHITGFSELSGEEQQACKKLREALRLREKYVHKQPKAYWGACDPKDFEYLYETGRDLGVEDTPLVDAVYHDNPTEDREDGKSTDTGAEGTGNNHLFHRLRPSPPFHPFDAPMPKSVRHLIRYRAVDGLVHIYRVKDEGGVAPDLDSDAIMTSADDDTKCKAAAATGICKEDLAALEGAGGRPSPAAEGDESGDDGGDGDEDTGGDSEEQSSSAGGGRQWSGMKSPLITPANTTTPTTQAAAAEALSDDDDDWTNQAECLTQHIPSFAEFQRDYFRVLAIVHSAPVKSFSYQRLKLLHARYNLHKLLNDDQEQEEQREVPHRDFYNVRKVDTHVHHSACMNQKHLLRFIKQKLKQQPDEVVIFRDGQFLTLEEVFESLKLTAYDLSIDTLDMHADSNTFHRFDRFNLKYNPCGQSRLREIFLKTDNLIAGRYLAEVTKEVINDLESSKYQLAEWRISIYGRKRSEWDGLAKWYYVNRLASPNVRWMIQIPRLYEVYKGTGQIDSFQDMLDNIFQPLFEVTVDPSANLPLYHFLNQVVGFDCVDDESKHEMGRDSELPPPKEWTSNIQPPYHYWAYYLSANLRSLNELRAKRKMTQFTFRPHAGEAGDVDHLMSAFLTAEAVNHGITMKREPAVQYLYYLAQVGLAMSPLSNNKLFVDYARNPFLDYFARGLNVCLSTDDPLLLHYTKEPLVEEYCMAAQVWKLSSVDLCEIARSSVLHSGFEHGFKMHFLGQNYHKPGPAGNDINYTNVPGVRLQFRTENLINERFLVATGRNPGPNIAAEFEGPFSECSVPKGLTADDMTPEYTAHLIKTSTPVKPKSKASIAAAKTAVAAGATGTRTGTSSSLKPSALPATPRDVHAALKANKA